jgi:uncharacterized 2Fe-2S/4Fe-4S cluster protein (DUF4445 family)
MEGGKTEIVNVQPGDTTDRNYAIAMDIGTTTIYGQLIDLKSGEVLAERGDFNGQISYGEDVISRIVYAEKEGGLERLHAVVTKPSTPSSYRIVRRAKVDPEDIAAITLAGNTTMTQLLLKVNPRYIRRSPYVPASTLYPPIGRWTRAGVGRSRHRPGLSGRVQLRGRRHRGRRHGVGHVPGPIELTLFMDIGTNAEIVIGNKDWLACAACSAGPAFEGGGIKFGMRAAKGAIEDFSLDPAPLEPMLITIGNVRPKGICGSGLIIMTATMFEMGLINNLGKFNRELDTTDASGKTTGCGNTCWPGPTRPRSTGTSPSPKSTSKT